MSFRINFLRKMFVEANVAGSIYTRDINSPITLDSFDNALFKMAKKIAIVNGTTEFNSAGDAAIGYKSKTFGLKLQYKRIDPGF
ncbi:hypothetical protein ACNJPU_21225, partial [Mycobacterium tuberculosis]